MTTKRKGILVEVAEWQVAKCGYKWLDAWDLTGFNVEVETALYLTHGFPLSAEIEHRSYSPTEKHGLFMAFAATEGTKEGMLAFANQYGPLGCGLGRPIVVRSIDEPDSYAVGSGEPFSEWQREVTDMRLAIWFWKLAESRDMHTLGKCIAWSQNRDAVGYRYWSGEIDNGLPDAFGSIASSHFRSGLLSEFEPGDLVEPALMVAKQIVGDHLRDRVLPSVLYESARHWLDMCVRPGGLIGLLWLQLAAAIRERRKFLQCKQCGEYFELSEHGVKTGKQFCSDACKNKAYRQRQLEAWVLHQEGKSPKEIAATVGADLPTIERWIRQLRDRMEKTR